MYRIYANGCEFGIDYPDLSAARAVKARFAACFPRVRYLIRRVGA